MAVALDQAASLRAAHFTTLSTRPALPLVAVASGKGGVGKTFLAVNLALALAARGTQPLLVDLDWGLANVDVALGLAPRRHASHVLRGECPLEDALLTYSGVTILPNGCGDAPDDRQGTAQEAALLDHVRAAGLGHQVTLADTHPGLGERTLSVLRAATLSLVVTTPDPTSLTDTYALLKVLHQRPLGGQVGVVVNGASGPEQAVEVAEHLDAITRRFLGLAIPMWGFIPTDAAVGRAVRRQCSLLESSPASPSAGAVRELAGTVHRLLSQTTDQASGRAGA